MNKAMFRASRYVVVLLAVVALGITLQRRIPSAGDHAKNAVMNSFATGTVALATDGDEPDAIVPGSIPALRGSENGQMRKSDSLPPAANGPSSSQSFTALAWTSNQGNSEESDHGTDLGAQDPAAVIGRPFPLSPSIDAQCKALRSQQDKDSGCNDVHETLMQFAREPRDEAWAGKLERQIRDYFLTRESREWAIRALECRTSICAIECTSGYQGLCHLEYEFSSSIGLLEYAGASGHEIDVSGARVVVSVFVLTRREPLK